MLTHLWYLPLFDWPVFGCFFFSSYVLKIQACRHKVLNQTVFQMIHCGKNMILNWRQKLNRFRLLPKLRVVPPYFKSQSFASVKVTVSLRWSTAPVCFIFSKVLQQSQFFLLLQFPFILYFFTLLLFQWLKVQKVRREWCQVHPFLFCCEKLCAVSQIAVRLDQFTIY